MPVTKSPFRYPGGKTQLTEFVKHTLSINNIVNGTYCEPFCGGAGLSLALLFSNTVSNLLLNDIDVSIYSVWYAILNETRKLIAKIDSTNVTIEEWRNQKEIFDSRKSDTEYSFELAFATFFLNRTNHSGIIAGGPIGGQEQRAKNKISCRFNKQSLTQKILNIADKKKHIYLYNLDAIVFIDTHISINKQKDLFIFFDPPYFKQGKNLYTNFYTEDDHLELSKKITMLHDHYWVTTYDVDPFIKKIYASCNDKEYALQYSANRVRRETEYLFHNNKTKVESWDKVIFR